MTGWAAAESNRIYLGEIMHRGNVFAGQHEAIIERALWDRVQAVFAENSNERRQETWHKRGPEFLLAGLIFTEDGERLQPSFTTKANGRRYRYYVPKRMQAFGASHPIGRLPAEPIEAMVLNEIHAQLRAPEAVQAVCEAAHARGLTEPQVVLTLLHNLAGVWAALYPAERVRIARLLIKKVVVSESAVSIVWRDIGWSALVGELAPGAIGAELAELEEVAA